MTTSRLSTTYSLQLLFEYMYIFEYIRTNIFERIYSNEYIFERIYSNEYIRTNIFKRIYSNKYIRTNNSNIRIYLNVQKWIFEYTNIFVMKKKNICIRILNIRCLIFEYSNIWIYLCYTGSGTRQSKSSSMPQHKSKLMKV